MQYQRLDGPNSKDRAKMTWLKVVNNNFKKLGKADMQDRTRWKQLCCKRSIAWKAAGIMFIAG